MSDVTNEGTITGAEPTNAPAVQTGEQVPASPPSPPTPTDLTAAATALHTPILEALEAWVQNHVVGVPEMAANTSVVNQIRAHIGTIKSLVQKVWP